MGDLNSEIERMHDRLNPSGLRAVRLIDEKLAQLKGPMAAYIDNTKIIQNLFPGSEIFNTFKKIEYTSSLLGKDISYYRKFIDASELFKKLMYSDTYLKNLPTSFTPSLDFASDYSLQQGEDLEISEYQILTELEEVSVADKKIYLKQFKSIKRIIKDIYKDNNQLYYIHHREFEEMITELLLHRNINAALTKQTRDGGKDIICIQNWEGFDFKLLVECKRYAPNRKIGVNFIREFSDVIRTSQANKGIIFTTSYFSPDAEKYRKNHVPYLLEFKDHDDIVGWVNSYVE